MAFPLQVLLRCEYVVHIWLDMLLKMVQGDAKKFKKERETNMAFFGDERREIVDASEIVTQVVSNLGKDEYRSTYTDAMQAQGVTLSDAEVSLVLLTIVRS